MKAFHHIGHARRLVLTQIVLPVLALASCAGPPAQDTTVTRQQNGSVAEDPFREQRRNMVEQQIRARGIRDTSVLGAMLRVPRHRFVPPSEAHLAYEDHPLPIGYEQTISQPYIVAYMTEAADFSPGDSVLEIGTGSGYQAAILGELASAAYSIEIIPELAERASGVLRELGYENVHVKAGNGYLGWPEHAPFDAIVVTAAPDHLPRPLVDQLSPDGGRMVIPIGPVGDVQTLWLVTRNGEDVAMEEVVLVQFVPLTREEP